MAPPIALAIGLACLVVARLLFLALRGSGERWAGGPSAPLRTMVVLGSGESTTHLPVHHTTDPISQEPGMLAHLHPWRALLGGEADRDRRPCARAGGHTAEMLTMTAALSRAGYAPRCYVVAATDNHSAEKALAAEKGVRTRHGPLPQRSMALFGSSLP